MGNEEAMKIPITKIQIQTNSKYQNPNKTLGISNFEFDVCLRFDFLDLFKVLRFDF